MNKAMIIRLFGFFFVLNVFLMINLFFSVSRTILEPLGLVVASLFLFVPIKLLKPLEDQTLSVFKSSVVVILGMLLMGVLFSPIVLIFG
ncbi:hypothetical protein RIF24_06820 [Exiguobacterium acetylicum]|uniref:hypothetical protein n=1 Tax=Exiguobacterium acetylicum TaxID=41170 RepID=UPI003977E0E6